MLNPFARSGNATPIKAPVAADFVISDKLRGQLRSINPTLAKQLERESYLINMIDDLVAEAVASRNRKLLNLTDILLGGGGLAGGFPGAGLGAAAGIRGFQMPAVQTRLASGLQKAIEPAERLLTKELPRGLGKVAPEVEKGARQLFIGGAAK